jgi:hypothetical protein
MSDERSSPYSFANRFRRALEEWRRNPTLLSFLRVLVLPHEQAQLNADAQFQRNYAAHQDRVKILATALEEIGRGGDAQLPEFMASLTEQERAEIIQKVTAHALPYYLRQLASAETVELPEILHGRFDKAHLNEVVREYLKEVRARNAPARRSRGRGRRGHSIPMEVPDWGGLALRVWWGHSSTQNTSPSLECAVKAAVHQHIQAVQDAKRNDPKSPVKPNWFETAGRLLSVGSGLSEELGETPWSHAITVLKRKWQGPAFDSETLLVGDAFSEYVRHWVFNEGAPGDPDDRTKELARLDSAVVQHELLAEIRNQFPHEARKWFGPLMGEKLLPLNEAMKAALRFIKKNGPVIATQIAGEAGVTEERVRAWCQKKGHLYAYGIRNTNNKDGYFYDKSADRSRRPA